MSFWNVDPGPTFHKRSRTNVPKVGYFLGYPPVDVMAYTRNRGHDHSAHGMWHVYGCKCRVAATKPYFDAYAECTQADWKLYLEGARLGDLAALHAVSPA